MINKQNDDEIITLINEILSFANFKVETYNEAVLFKLMDLRGTPIRRYSESTKDIDVCYSAWVKSRTDITDDVKNALLWWGLLSSKDRSDFCDKYIDICNLNDSVTDDDIKRMWSQEIKSTQNKKYTKEYADYIKTITDAFVERLSRNGLQRMGTGEHLPNEEDTLISLNQFQKEFVTFEDWCKQRGIENQPNENSDQLHQQEPDKRFNYFTIYNFCKSHKVEVAFDDNNKLYQCFIDYGTKKKGGIFPDLSLSSYDFGQSDNAFQAMITGINNYNKNITRRILKR